ncbi:sulfate transporter CysZ [Oceanicoccus sagamiensis]|uniref:Sulfate transporter CysZ n=1 Tax=Oceanicoccus sagamiensis TaxID=716816 RepID=A0A1X9NIF9_9GAMM|nr:sulfate transporter CysZ [Oceanicoccus sagamiensis]ARN74677.1 sulfate transporter CysZ [Oceanicoccus sagamiensis]
MKGNPVTGFNYLLEGFRLITQPGLRLFVLIPLLINIVIFSLLINLTIAQFSGWIEAAMEWVPDWLSFIRWILWPMAVLLILTVVMYTFSVIANIIASPFNGLLAEKTEELLTGKEVPGFETIGQAVLSFPKSIGRELAKLVYYIPLALLVLIISFIPLINAISPLLWFLLGAWMMVIQYCDYPMDNHQVSFGDMKQRIKVMRLTSTGFGASVMVGTMIPLVNLIIMPAAVCGATAYWAREMKTEVAVKTAS